MLFQRNSEFFSLEKKFHTGSLNSFWSETNCCW